MKPEEGESWEYLLNSYYMPNPVLAIGIITVNHSGKVFILLKLNGMWEMRRGSK